MEGNFKLTPLAAALALVLGSPLVMAQDPDGTSTSESDSYTSSRDDSYSSSSDIRSFEKNYKEDTTVKQARDSSVSIKKKIDVTKDLDIRGAVAIRGQIQVNSAAMAVVDGQQLIHDNVVTSSNLDNNASVTGNPLSDAQGNIGVNVAAGDANAQENAAALAAADAGFVFGAIDAEVFNQQEAKGNQSLPGSVYGADGYGWLYSSGGNDNTASLDSDALTNATGNIGVNIAAGNFNGQRNSLAAATGVASLGEANVSSQQQIGENDTVNQGSIQAELHVVQVDMSGRAVGGYSGHSDQIGDVYPDTWSGVDDGSTPANDPHPNGSPTGHIDLDSAAQGAQDLNLDLDGDGQGDTAGGALAFGEAGDIALGVQLSGTVWDFDLVIDTVENNASISGNALQNATGNIGVNVVAGTNNLQSNSLAVVSLAAPSSPGGGGGGGE